jgi:hypothetical protein
VICSIGELESVALHLSLDELHKARGQLVVHIVLSREILKSGSSALLMKPVRLRWETNENPLEKQSDRIPLDAGSSKVQKNQF